MKLCSPSLVVWILLLSLSHTADGATLKTLPVGPLSDFQKKQLIELKTAAPPLWMNAAQRLTSGANSAVLEGLIELSKDKNDDLRARAGFVLAKIPAKEALAQALDLARCDKSTDLRLTVASYLMAAGIPELLEEAELIDAVKKGLEDKRKDVQFCFAMILAAIGDRSGEKILEKMLSHSDHHRRESAAEALAALGNDAGINVLFNMLTYTDKNHPFLKANKAMKKNEETWKDLLRKVDEERIRVCAHMARLKNEKGLKVLQKWAASDDAEIAKAAGDAIVAIKEAQSSQEEK